MYNPAARAVPGYAAQAPNNPFANQRDVNRAADEIFQRVDGQLRLSEPVPLEVGAPQYEPGFHYPPQAPFDPQRQAEAFYQRALAAQHLNPLMPIYAPEGGFQDPPMVSHFDSMAPTGTSTRREDRRREESGYSRQRAQEIAQMDFERQQAGRMEQLDKRHFVPITEIAAPPSHQELMDFYSRQGGAEVLPPDTMLPTTDRFGNVQFEVAGGVARNQRFQFGLLQEENPFRFNRELASGQLRRSKVYRNVQRPPPQEVALIGETPALERMRKKRPTLRSGPSQGSSITSLRELEGRLGRISLKPYIPRDFDEEQNSTSVPEETDRAKRELFESLQRRRRRAQIRTAAEEEVLPTPEAVEISSPQKRSKKPTATKREHRTKRIPPTSTIDVQPKSQRKQPDPIEQVRSRGLQPRRRRRIETRALADPYPDPSQVHLTDPVLPSECFSDYHSEKTGTSNSADPQADWRQLVLIEDAPDDEDQTSPEEEVEDDSWVSLIAGLDTVESNSPAQKTELPPTEIVIEIEHLGSQDPVSSRDQLEEIEVSFQPEVPLITEVETDQEIEGEIEISVGEETVGEDLEKPSIEIPNEIEPTGPVETQPTETTNESDSKIQLVIEKDDLANRVDPVFGSERNVSQSDVAPPDDPNSSGEVSGTAVQTAAEQQPEKQVSYGNGALANMTANELREVCVKNGLPKSGNKTELVQRILSRFP